MLSPHACSLHCELPDSRPVDCTGAVARPGKAHMRLSVLVICDAWHGYVESRLEPTACHTVALQAFSAAINVACSGLAQQLFAKEFDDRLTVVVAAQASECPYFQQYRLN